jgi:pimeloyl-ACP methyl ester carboxylesterase
VNREDAGATRDERGGVPVPAHRKPTRNGLVWAAGILAGVASGIVAERALMGRAKRREDPERGEAFGELPGERLPVTAFDGTSLHVRAVGPQDAPVVVFAHGITLNLTTWHYQWRALSDRYRCVLYDQRGHGGSGTSPGSDYSMEAMGRDLRSVLDAVAPAGPAVVVGHSMGGMSLISMAGRHPEEFGSRVVGAVLVDTTASDVVREAVGSLGVRVERALRPLSRWYTSDLDRVERIRRRIRRSGTDLAFLVARLTNFGPDASPAQVDFISRIATEAPPEVWSHTLANLIEMDLRHAVRHVSVPTLVVVGDLDRLTPKTSAEALLRELPLGRGVLLKGAGHISMMERHAAFNDVLARFLDEVLPVRGAVSGAAVG